MMPSRPRVPGAMQGQQPSQTTQLTAEDVVDVQPDAVEDGDAAAHALYMQKLEKMLDLGPFIAQIEHLLSQPIKIPADPVLQQQLARQRHNIFSVRNIHKDEETRRRERAILYNTDVLKGREWLRDLLLEESDSEDDGEPAITQQDLEMDLKMHKERRKMQRKYHMDPANKQYSYYSAGLLSEHDLFPEHQAAMLRQHSTSSKKEAPTASASSSVSHGGPSTSSASHNWTTADAPEDVPGPSSRQTSHAAAPTTVSSAGPPSFQTQRLPPLTAKRVRKRKVVAAATVVAASATEETAKVPRQVEQVAQNLPTESSQPSTSTSSTVVTIDDDDDVIRVDTLCKISASDVPIQPLSF